VVNYVSTGFGEAFTTPYIIWSCFLMTTILWVIVSLIAYIGGLSLLMSITPRLLRRSYDEMVFMGQAILVILGALLAFGAVAVTFGIFNGVLGVRILDFALLAGIVLVGALRSWTSFHPPYARTTFAPSRIGAGLFCLCLVLAAVYYIVSLFVS
jgi:hypothetical protein